MFFFNSSGKEVTVIMPQHIVYLFNAMLLVVYKNIYLSFFFLPHYFWFTSFLAWTGKEKMEGKTLVNCSREDNRRKICIQLRHWAIKDFNYCITMAIYCLSLKTSLPFPWWRMQQQVICWRCQREVHRSTSLRILNTLLPLKPKSFILFRITLWIVYLWKSMTMCISSLVLC